MLLKEFKTTKEQIDILRSRGIVIETEKQIKEASDILLKENYYNVINGYKKLFLDKDKRENSSEMYKNGTTLDEIYTLYCFDKDIKSIYLKYLLRLENQVKTAISREFSSVYGNKDYLKLQNFDFFEGCDKEKIVNITKLIGEINLEISKQTKNNNEIIVHYLTKYGFIPPWILVNILTFGKITRFYSCLKDSDKMKIAKSFKVSPNELFKYMNMLSLARNICAHDERFYDIKFRTMLKTKEIKNFQKLNMTKKADGSYVNGTNDAFAIAIIFAILLEKEELDDFLTSMTTAFSKLSEHLHTIDLAFVMFKMGYNDDYMNLMKLK